MIRRTSVARSNFSSLAGCLLMSLALAGLLSTVLAAPPKPLKAGPRYLTKLDEEYIAKLQGDDPAMKVGDKVTVTIQSGKKYEDVEITDLQLGKEPNSLKVIGCTSSKGLKQKLQVSTVVRIDNNDRLFDVVQQSSTKAHLLLDLARRDELATERLAKSDYELWTEPTREEREREIAELKEMCQKVGEAFPDRKFLAKETEFFLIYTDMPANQVGGYIANLDAMYRQLCVAFSLPPDKNIWLGKGAIFIFADQKSFIRFEKEFMENDENLQNFQGVNHGDTSGRNITAFYRGDDPAFFAGVLVHETSHGFVHRYRSSAFLDSWIDEGIAEWNANVCVPASREVQLRQSDAIAAMRRTGSMGGDFFSEDAEFDKDQYGAASLLTEFMLQTDPHLYRAFLGGIKDGHTPAEALKGTYGGTFPELIQSFGRSIGVPNLRP